METNTPSVPDEKKWRWAAALNLILPGAGLFYVGRRKLGALLAGAFLLCLFAALGIFVAGYARYMKLVLDSDLMREGQLEQLQDVFHAVWLLALLLIAAVIQIAALVALARCRKIGGATRD